MCPQSPSCLASKRLHTRRLPPAYLRWHSRNGTQHHPSIVLYLLLMVPPHTHTPGDWGPCGDFHALNKATVPSRYFIPHLSAILTRCHNFLWHEPYPPTPSPWSMLPHNTSVIYPQLYPAHLLHQPTHSRQHMLLVSLLPFTGGGVMWWTLNSGLASQMTLTNHVQLEMVCI